MNVITVASRKGGAGKTTLTAHLAGHAHALGRRCLVIDADPQGSLSLCNALREEQALPLLTAERGIERALALAAVENYDYVFIDTAPTLWVMVQTAIRAATLVVVPARPYVSMVAPFLCGQTFSFGIKSLTVRSGNSFQGDIQARSIGSRLRC